MKKAVVITVATLSLVAAAAYFGGRYLGYMPGNPLENAREALQPNNREKQALEEALDIAPALEPVSAAEFDIILTTPQERLVPKEPQLESAAKKGIITDLYQGVVVSQGNGTAKVYVGDLEDIAVGKWLLSTAFEYKLVEGGVARGLVSVPERQVDIQSVRVVAWTNLPQDHSLVLELQEQLRSQP